MTGYSVETGMRHACKSCGVILGCHSLVSWLKKSWREASKSGGSMPDCLSLVAVSKSGGSVLSLVPRLKKVGERLVSLVVASLTAKDWLLG